MAHSHGTSSSIHFVFGHFRTVWRSDWDSLPMYNIPNNFQAKKFHASLHMIEQFKLDCFDTSTAIVVRCCCVVSECIKRYTEMRVTSDRFHFGSIFILPSLWRDQINFWIVYFRSLWEFVGTQRRPGLGNSCCRLVHFHHLFFVLRWVV